MITANVKVRNAGFELHAAFKIPAKGVTAVFGASGCGKTTLLRAIAGLENSQGALSVGDETWQSDSACLAAYQRSVGFVFQDTALFPHLSVQGNLEYAAKRAQTQVVSLQQATDLMGLSGMLNKSVTTLSGGEKQRVAIARALAASPKLLLMDEPLSALDQTRKNEIMPFLELLHKSLNIPIIYVSHSMAEVARLADHLVYMEAGKVIASGEIGTMLTSADTPLSHGQDASALVQGKVESHDDEYALTTVAFPGGKVVVPQYDLPTGQGVRLRIFARDVSITLEHQQDTSIQNIMPAVVDQIWAENPSQMTVRLAANGTKLLARVTRKSAESLGLVVGMNVYAQVKSVALLV